MVFREAGVGRSRMAAVSSADILLWQTASSCSGRAVVVEHSHFVCLCTTCSVHAHLGLGGAPQSQKFCGLVDRSSI